MSLQQQLADIGLKTMSRVHRAILRTSNGRVLNSAFGMPVVELHTVGRKSGLPRSTMLTAPVVDGQRRPVRARHASAGEKAELWPRVVAAYRGYAGYQRRTQRDIPLVICDPR